MIGVGILGCSDIARRKFIPALMNSKKARLAAVASRDLSKGALFAAGLPAQVTGYEELLHDPGIDLVYISLPNHLHELWSIRALREGKHVVCEKPLGLCAGSVDRMLDAAKLHRVLLYENLMYLGHPQHRAVKALVEAGRIGRIRSLRCVFTIPGVKEGDFRLDPALGGGAFHDLNRYPLSAALYFLKGAQHRFVRGDLRERDGLDLAMEAVTVTEEGEEFSFRIAFGEPYRAFYQIGGERGTIRVERCFTTPADLANTVALTIDGQDESFSVPPCDHFLQTIDHVCSLVRQGGDFSAVHDRARQLAQLAEMLKNNCTGRG